MCKLGIKGGHTYRSSQVWMGEPMKGSICHSCGDTHPGYDIVGLEKSRTPRCANKRCARISHNDGICLTAEQLGIIGDARCA